MAGKNVSEQEAKDKALSERIEMVRGVQRRILAPLMTFVELLDGYYNAEHTPKRADPSLADVADMLRMLTLGGHVELMMDPPGSDLTYFVTASVFEDLIEAWMQDIEELDGGAS